MTSKSTYLIGELIILFVGIPIVLALDFQPIFKVIIGLIGIVYCIWVAFKTKLISKKSLFEINFKENWTRLLLSFIIVASSSTFFLYVVQPENLFIVVKNNPSLWIFILCFYSIFSVYPQELLYRSFFFERYQHLFRKSYYLIWTNILIFPLAHLFFNNGFVLIVTFVGGMLFTSTYFRTKSVLFTSIEHAIYGGWLFTVGMGEMLAFPMPH